MSIKSGVIGKLGQKFCIQVDDLTKILGPSIETVIKGGTSPSGVHSTSDHRTDHFTNMPVLELGENNLLSFDTTESSNIHLKRTDRPELTLCPEQTSPLLLKLETIEADAKAYWQWKGVREQYSYPLGWGVYLTVLEYKDHIYFDTRQWWQVPSTGEIKPTKKGVRLNSSECDTLKRYKTILISSISAITEAQTCMCTISQEIDPECARCSPFS